jgi:hypothetical protein
MNLICKTKCHIFLLISSVEKENCFTFIIKRWQKILFYEYIIKFRMFSDQIQTFILYEISRLYRKRVKVYCRWRRIGACAVTTKLMEELVPHNT